MVGFFERDLEVADTLGVLCSERLELRDLSIALRQALASFV